MRHLFTQHDGVDPFGSDAQYLPILVGGVEYALVRVRESAFDALPYPDEMVQRLEVLMGRPVALMTDRSCRVYGPDPVAAYLSRRPVWNLPWRRARRYFG